MTKEALKRQILNIVKKNTDLLIITESVDFLEITFNITGKNNKVTIYFSNGKKTEVVITIEDRGSITTTLNNIHSVDSYALNKYEYGIVISYEDDKEILLI